MKSGMSITTGGTTISAMLSAKQDVRGRGQRMRAMRERGERGETAVETITAPSVRITLFLNQVRNFAAVQRLAEVAESESGQGRP